MKYRTSIITWLTAIFAIPLYLHSQEPLYHEEVRPVPGSEVNLVTGLATDPNNFLWITTQSGVFRYDGLNYKHYTVLNTPELQFQRMAGVGYYFDSLNRRFLLLIDAKGNLYKINAHSSLERELDQHKPSAADQNRKYLLGNRNIPMAIIHDSIGYITSVLYTHQNKVAYVIEDPAVVRRYGNGLASSGKIFEGIKDFRLTATVSAEKFYVNSSNAILCWDKHSAVYHPVSLKGDIQLHSLIPDYKKLKFLNYPGSGAMVFQYDRGIYEMSETADPRVLDTKLIVNTGVDDAIQSFFWDKSLRLMACYFIESGFKIYRPFEFSLLKSPLATRFNTKDLGYHYTVIKDGNGVLTVNNSGIVRLGLDGTSRQVLGGNFSKHFLFRDRSGNTWFFSYKNLTLCSLSPDNAMVDQLTLTDTWEDMSSMYQENDSVFYVLSNINLVKFTIDRSGKANQPKILATRTKDEQFTFIFKLDANRFWVGSDMGLYEFDAATGKLNPINELRNVYARSAIQLGPGNYLVGSYAKGIYQYFHGKWISLAAINKKIPSSAHAFVLDSINKVVWVSSNEGLINIPQAYFFKPEAQRPPTVPFRHFTQFGPGISREFNGGSNLSGIRLSDTCFAFANARGIVIFDPTKMTRMPMPGNVIIEPPEGNSQLFNKETGHLAFKAAIPYYGNQEELEVWYQLTNTDNEWHALNLNEVITYNDIAPGNHELSFRLRHRYDPFTEPVIIKANTFHISRAWHQQTWFKLLLFLGGLSVVVMLHQVRLWYIVKKKKELEETVRAKTAELQESNSNLNTVIEELRISESQLRQSNFLKDEYYSVLTHDLRSPLRFLSFNISQLLEKLPESDAAQLRKGLLSAYECTNDVQKLIEEFVVWIRDNDQKLKVQPVPTRIEAVVNDVKKIYDHGMEGNQNRLVTDVEGDLVLLTDPKMLFIILRNAVDNANKYTEKGTITVSAKRQNGNLELSVKDTGRGMRKELVNELMALQDEPAESNLRKRKSLGFYIMSMLTRKLDGRYTITSDKDQGTELKFILPDWKTRT